MQAHGQAVGLSTVSQPSCQKASERGGGFGHGRPGAILWSLSGKSTLGGVRGVGGKEEGELASVHDVVILSGSEVQNCLRGRAFCAEEI